MKRIIRFLSILGMVASAVVAQNITSPVFVLKDGDASAANYSGTDKTLYVDGGVQQSIGWITFQMQGVDISKIVSAKLALYVNGLKAPGLVRIKLLVLDVAAPENNVGGGNFIYYTATTDSLVLGTSDIEKVVQFDLTSAVKSGTFKGVALVADDGLAVSFDSKEGHLAPVLMLTNNVDNVAAKWQSGAVDPTAGLGKDGDYYLNTSSGNVSAKTTGVWTVVTNIAGAAGSPGIQGLKGDKGDPGTPGATGTFQNGAVPGQMLYWNGSAWIAIAPGIHAQTLTICEGTPMWGPCPAILATVTTTAISVISNTSALSGGNITYDGGGYITARGVCWSTSPNPTIANSKTADSIGPGIFYSNLAGLIPSTTYYVRAYVSSFQLGTAYGAQVSFTTAAVPLIAPGAFYQGGYISYVLQPGDPGYNATVPHGIIAAPLDQSTSMRWYNGTYILTGASATALGTGNANTNTIVSAQGGGSYAAQLCADLVTGGYSDWYLPSKDELNKLYLNRALIGSFGTFIGGNAYCSSSESDITNVWVHYTGNGLQTTQAKIQGFGVRAIRAF